MYIYVWIYCYKLFHTIQHFLQNSRKVGKYISKRYRQMDLLRPTVFFSAKNSKVAIIKTKSATIAFFTFPPYFPLALFSFATLILR